MAANSTSSLVLPDFLPRVTPGLYLVATPIGNRGDITLRALSVLAAVDVIYCEDTRESRKLLQTYAIKKPLVAYHDHNAAEVRPTIIAQLQQGKKIALISDAGTPLISDPGYKLVQACYENDLPLTTIPGPSAVLSALQLSGMPSDRFMFCGFANDKHYDELAAIPATLIFFESPRRVVACLQAMQLAFKHRTVAVVREITKLFEEAVRGEFAEVIEHFTKTPAKGEIVIVLSPQIKELQTSDDSWHAVDTRLTALLGQYSLKDAAMLVATEFSIKRKEVYQRALWLHQHQQENL